MRAIRYNLGNMGNSIEDLDWFESQSAMRAIRYNPRSTEPPRTACVTQSQSAMRAIRYNQTPKNRRLARLRAVAIRYACNKI